MSKIGPATRGGRIRRGAATALTVLCVLLVASCGLPEATSPLELDPTDVPYQLLSPSAGHSLTPTRPARTTSPDIYLLTEDERLVPRAAPLTPSGLIPVLDGVLSRLVSGPDEAQRASGLATALGADAHLTVRGVSNGTAVIELDLGQQDPSASRLPLAIGQVVLSATSVEGVDGVRFVRDGTPIEVPLPDGSLTQAPLTSADYAPLLATPATPSAKARPT